jgi:hypothetical protein
MADSSSNPFGRCTGSCGGEEGSGEEGRKEGDCSGEEGYEPEVGEAEGGSDSLTLE